MMMMCLRSAPVSMSLGFVYLYSGVAGFGVGGRYLGVGWVGSTTLAQLACAARVRFSGLCVCVCVCCGSAFCMRAVLCFEQVKAYL